MISGGAEILAGAQAGWPWLAGLGAWGAYGFLYSAWAGLRWPASGVRVRVRGGRLHALVAGEGPPVVLLHGASANAREFTRLSAALAPNFRVIALDRPGYGHSSRTPKAHRLGAQAATIAQAIEALQAGPAVIAAHSLGAAAALRLALDHPGLVRGLALFAPASHPYPGENAWHTRLAATPLVGSLFARAAAPLFGPLLAPGAIRNTFAPADPPSAYAREAGVGLAFRPSSFRANARDVAATRREFAAQYFRYSEIEAPTVIVTAEADRVVSPRIHARALAAAMPRAELVIVPGAGHMPHQINPETAALAVRRAHAIASGLEDG